ncbi:MAG: HEAT repeat domain-containing protein [Myxococcota bacterium]
MTFEPTDVDEMLRALAASPDRKRFEAFLRLGVDATSAVRRGLRDDDWRVRRDCLRFLDHHVDPESEAIAIELLRGDPSPEVRKWAAHALGCDRCKGGADLALDPVPALVEAARSDASLRVRRSAVVALAWTRPPDARIHAFLAELAAAERDPKLRRHAIDGMARHASAPRDA